MSEGYTYTTISAHAGEPVRVGVSFYLDQQAWIAVCGAGEDRPHLALKHADVSVSIGPADPGQVTGQDARIARWLAQEAARYAAEIERLAAASSPGGAAA
jgi:hypothetical protein